jgi:PAS domain S-box-containing protein
MRVGGVRPVCAIAARAGWFALGSPELLSATQLHGGNGVLAPVAMLLGAIIVLASAAVRFWSRRQLKEMVRLAAEHSRAEQERNHLFSQTTDLVYIGDLEGRPVQLNLAWQRALGYSPSELDNKTLTAMLPGEDLPRISGAIHQLLQGSGNKLMDVRMRARDGSIRWFSWTLGKLPGGDRLMGIGRDITELREAAEEMSRKNEELFEALRAARSAMEEKARFLAATGHEIRNPLHGILGTTELLLTTRLTPEQREYAQTVRDSAESLVGLLNDLLDYSRIGARGVQMHNAPYKPREVVRGVVQLMTAKAAENSVRLRNWTDAAVSEAVIGDAGRVRQVLMNLVANAVKFTDSGEVRIDVTEGTSTGWLRVAVTDTGPGIAPADQHAIFEPFVQLRAGTGRGGSGLGLSISKQLVEAMGGRIGLISQPGAGSTFWFEVPAPRKTAPAHSEQGLARVLVAEDNQVNQTLTRRLLEKAGYRVDVAGNGVEAFSAAQSGYDLILMDLQMPEMDGIAATGAIRQWEQAQPGRTRRPIVALTASALPNDLTRCLEAGMDDYLSKPFTPEALHEKVDRWLRQSAVAVTGA